MPEWNELSNIINKNSTYIYKYDYPLSRGRVAYDNFSRLHSIITNENYAKIHIFINSQERFGRTFVFLSECLYYLALQYDKILSVTFSKYISKYFLNMNKSENKINAKGASMYLYMLDELKNALSLSVNIVDKIPVQMSQRLHEDMVSRIGEVFNNSIEHAQAKHVLGGWYTKPNKMFCFACYDTGVGIVNKVKNYNIHKVFSDKEALMWALEPQNTTSNNPGIPRGQGLKLLKDFVYLNHGTIRICSGRVLYTYNCRDGKLVIEKYENLKNEFVGTLFEMDINPSGLQYRYKGEEDVESHIS